MVYKKGKKIYFDLLDLALELGMIFEGHIQFKDAFPKYAIAKRFHFKLFKNEKKKAMFANVMVVLS